MNEKTLVDPEAVGEAIRRAVKRSGANSHEVAIAISGDAAITKVIQMPRGLRDAELEAQVEMQADQYIPFPMDEVSYDFEVLGPSEKDAESIDVLLVASRTDNVEQRRAAVVAAGLTTRIVDVEAFALENACRLMTHQMPDGGIDRTHRGGRFRRQQHHFQRAAQPQGRLYARLRLRRPAADRRNHAHLRPVAWKKPAAPRRKAACRATTRPRCSIPSSTT